MNVKFSNRGGREGISKMSFIDGEKTYIFLCGTCLERRKTSAVVFLEVFGFDFVQ